MPVAQKLRCRIDRITDHGSQVYSLDLLPERTAPRFSPGQFLHLAIDPYEPGSFWPDSRVFSIASSPEERARLRITYSVRGKFTARMAQELQTGNQVWVKLPYGDFVIRASSEVALLAGGTGITAFTAFLLGLKQSSTQPVNLFYGARSRDLLIYREMIDQISQVTPALTCRYYFEQGTAQSKDEETGCLSVEGAMSRVENPVGADYYLSGPPPMLKSFTQTLLTSQVPSNQIHVDAWE